MARDVSVFVSSPDDVISERRRVEQVARRIDGEFGTSRA